MNNVIKPEHVAKMKSLYYPFSDLAEPIGAIIL